jgi:hypothetical protein
LRMLPRPSGIRSELLVTDGSSTRRRASGGTRLTPSGALDTPSGTCTRRHPISSSICPSPTWSFSREISTTVSLGHPCMAAIADGQENSLTIVTLPSTLHSPPPSDPLLPSQEPPESLRSVPSSRTLSSVSHPESERSLTRKSQDGRSLVNT